MNIINDKCPRQKAAPPLKIIEKSIKFDSFHIVLLGLR